MKSYRRHQSFAILFGVSMFLLWIYFIILKPSLFVLIFGLPVLAVILREVVNSINRLRTLAKWRPEFVSEIILKLIDGRALEKHLVATPVPNGVLLWFEYSRNLIEGDVTLREILSPVIRETTVRLRPGWRRFAKQPGIEPIAIRFSEMIVGETWLDFRLQFYNRNVFANNPRSSAKVRIYAICETYHAEDRVQVPPIRRVGVK
jgi:hypothetical protein